MKSLETITPKKGNKGVFNIIKGYRRFNFLDYSSFCSGFSSKYLYTTIDETSLFQKTRTEKIGKDSVLITCYSCKLKT